MRLKNLHAMLKFKLQSINLPRNFRSLSCATFFAVFCPYAGSTKTIRNACRTLFLLLAFQADLLGSRLNLYPLSTFLGGFPLPKISHAAGPGVLWLRA